MIRPEPARPTVWTNDSLLRDARVTLFQKVLLCTDGTVTELLSLHCGKPIKARKIDQEFYTAAGSGAENAGLVRMLRRSVVLETDEGSPYLFAESHFDFYGFSEQVQHDLIETELPIGLLWRRERIEMHREIIERRSEYDPEVAGLLKVPVGTLLYSRTYRIIHGGREIGLITEKFASTMLL